MRSAWPLVVLLLASGCAGAGTPSPTPGAPLPDESGPGPFLVLEAKFVGSGEFYGHHCGRASVREGKVSLESDDRDELGEGPSIVVQPRLEGQWSTLGSGGFAMRLPAEVPDQSSGDPPPLARIEWLDEGRVRVDGDVYALPHEWTVERDEYRVELKLARGPSTVEWYHVPLCI